jgi:two-component system, OmpR family, sensor histidine kinase BaeS
MIRPGRSLRLRLLGLSLGVATLAVVATALLATYGTGSRLSEELEANASLLETDSAIRDALLDYAGEHRTWEGVEPLVRRLAEETGRRIELTTPTGETIADSAQLLGQGPAERPSTPAARVDAADPPDPPDPPDTPAALGGSGPGSDDRGGGGELSRELTLALNGWQLTDDERRQRQALADEAEECLAREGIEATIDSDPGVFPAWYADADADSSAARNGTLATYAGRYPGQERPPLPSGAVTSCFPDGLYEPSAATRALNEQAVALTAACLDAHGLAYEPAVDSNGMTTLRPPEDGDGERPPAWADCQDSARAEAARPYVAPPAELYLGTGDDLKPFSAGGWWRTAATVAGVLLVAALVTVLAGRRLVRPILALTGAAQRMGTGDRSARVRVPGGSGDEVTRLAEAFNAMAASIERSDRQRKALVSDIAHELRTPLANVRSHLEAAEDGVVPLDGDLITSLREEADLLERLVCDLQDLALADAGMLRIHPEERDAADLAGQAVAAHRARADASGVAVRVDAPPGPVPVLADPARLRQALGNLVSNAVTHTPPGGTVVVAVRGRGRGRSGDGVLLTVTDTGRGIAAEHLPRVFDRFYRADPSRSRTTGGSGLGLAITKHLVEAHGGTIEAASTPGRGSVFTIRLPGTD